MTAEVTAITAVDEITAHFSGGEARAVFAAAVCEQVVDLLFALVTTNGTAHSELQL